MSGTAAAPASPGALRRFLSTTFQQPLGSRIRADRVSGYYIDMRVKVRTPAWPPPQFPVPDDKLFVASTQWGLGAFEHYLESGRQEWLDAARAACDYLLERQHGGGELDGGWLHERPYPHTFRLEPPWVSAMAQGEGASLLVRVHGETGDDRLAEAAIRALRPLDVPSSRGGALALLDDRPFFEEYPTQPPSFVLNGAMYALWGVYDVALGLGDSAAAQTFREGLDTVAAGIERWDLGFWSRYDLYPHRRVNIASSAYHELHTHQLKAMNLIAPRRELESAAGRFERYGRSRLCRGRALALKVAFRVAVPRSPGSEEAPS